MSEVLALAQTQVQARDHLQERVRAAAADHQALRIRGGGSKDFLGQSLQGEILDTRALCGITNYEPSELVVTVLAGTGLRELEGELATQGQCLAFEPPHFSPATTVGGMVAAGLAGPARASVGGVRDYVLGLELVNGRAELLNFGGTVMKNVAGYDVSRLMVGAMGTLGLITQVSLKVLPFAPAEATLKLELTQTQALAQLHQWGAQALPLNASNWVQEDANGTSNNGATGHLYVRLRGAVAAVEAACTIVQAMGGQRLDAGSTTNDWRACRDMQLPFFSPVKGMALWRLSVPQTAPVLNLPFAQLIDWHGALRWLWAPLDASASVVGAAKVAGGSASVYWATDANGQPAKPQPATLSDLSASLRLIHQRLKAEFDPEHIFNPGRLFANL